MVLLVDPYHKVGSLISQVGDVGVQRAAVGPVSTEVGGDGPLVGIVE